MMRVWYKRRCFRLFRQRQTQFSSSLASHQVDGASLCITFHTFFDMCKKIIASALGGVFCSRPAHAIILSLGVITDAYVYTNTCVSGLIACASSSSTLYIYIIISRTSAGCGFLRSGANSLPKHSTPLLCRQRTVAQSVLGAASCKTANMQSTIGDGKAAAAAAAAAAGRKWRPRET
jgi:hypothetical protein